MAKHAEERRQYVASRRTQQEQHEAQLRAKKAELDAQVKSSYDAQLTEDQTAVDDMMQRIREEKERKRKERETMDEKLRKEHEKRSYKGHRDLDNRASRLSKKDED